MGLKGGCKAALLQRIHPAPSRVLKLSVETPAILIAFDLLVAPNGRRLTDETLDERRRLLEAFFRDYCRRQSQIRLSPSSTSLNQAKAWLRRTSATLDGVIAKRRDFKYRSGDRSGMQKIDPADRTVPPAALLTMARAAAPISVRCCGTSSPGRRNCRCCCGLPPMPMRRGPLSCLRCALGPRFSCEMW
jgi:hypothetical protein